MLGSQADELWSRPGDGDLHLLVLYSDDHVPVLVVAEHPGAGPPEPLQGLGGWVPVGVVCPHLDHGYLRREPAEEERRRGGIGTMMGDFQDREGSEVQNGPVTSKPSPL